VVFATTTASVGLAPTAHGAPAANAAATGPWFSDPVWWPLQVESRVDCTKHNPGCPTHHPFWGVDVIPTGQRDGNPPSQAGVFAMGAGVAHVGSAHGRVCGSGGTSDFGTWVWVEHGGGIISRYGHLSVIAIHDGQHVAAGDRLGTVGNTGDASKLFCDENYLDFQVRRGGVQGPSAEFSTRGVGSADGELMACTMAGEQRWPEELPGGIRRIDLLPKHALIPPAMAGCSAPSYAAASAAPVAVQEKPGDNSLTASWNSAPPGTDQLRVEFGRYEPSASHWENPWEERWHDLPAATRSTAFHDLRDRFKYRLRVWFHNSAGWSRHSDWVSGRPD
jgi:murein DD-endopeptidase MepM/ murein hydrolase activator NlpD